MQRFCLREPGDYFLTERLIHVFINLCEDRAVILVAVGCFFCSCTAILPASNTAGIRPSIESMVSPVFKVFGLLLLCLSVIAG